MKLKKILIAVCSITMMLVTFALADEAELTAEVYNSSKNRFELSTEVQVSVIEDEGVMMYSITDIVNVISNASMEETYSSIFFTGSYLNPVYNVMNLFITTENESIEISNSNYTVYNDEIYMTKEDINENIASVVITNDAISILDNTDKTPSIFKLLKDDERSMFVNALFALYNTYYEGYNVVMKYASTIKPVTSRKLAQSTGISGCTAAALYNYSYIYWDKNSILGENLPSLAALLVHESKHMQQYRIGDRSETETVLIQGKTMYYMNECGYMTDDDSVKNIIELYTNMPKCYQKGVKALESWYAEQMSDLAA